MNIYKDEIDTKNIQIEDLKDRNRLLRQMNQDLIHGYFKTQVLTMITMLAFLITNTVILWK